MFIIKNFIRLIVLIILLNSIVFAKEDRCVSYVQEVRRDHFAVFGVDYPYWYGVAQLKQESQCRDILSKDGIGSQGVSQITYKVWKGFLSKKGISNLSSTHNQILSQAYIMQSALSSIKYKHLWVQYQLYNGGGLVNKDVKNAQLQLRKNNVTHDEVFPFCKRGNTIYKSKGVVVQTISNCKINYDYSTNIYNYAKPYKIQSDSPKYLYW